MIEQLLERLQMVPDAVVREGFYAAPMAREDKFIFLQPYDSGGDIKGGPEYPEDVTLQVVAGIKLSSSTTPTMDLIKMVRQIRSAFFKKQRNPLKPEWLQEGFGFKELERCKFIMPEAHEKHGLAVLTFSISTSQTFED
ncbi:hypothetical protein MJ923_07885 [Shewanella sp. 3B26]|uniref:Uncharacterized protein n=1 Tax=Shewanella zhuhaiensis TaxID=2919576 RepID=A0AAJ1BI21_9GAMM|nr:hypothetical protein [Shewanella zhuhaiensis]MCH4294224.1 hypothetical protein [Shewanella zhuhaiensis]